MPKRRNTNDFKTYGANRECTEMYANANISGTQQGTRVGYPTRQPTTALQIGHRVGNGHERGGSVFLIITPVHAHRNVQQLRRHIRRNPRRHAPIRRNVRPRTLQTAPSLHNAEQGLNGPSLRETPPTNQTTETVKSRIISLEILLHAQRQIIMRQGRSAKTVPVYISVFIHQRHAVTGRMLFDPFR